MHSFLLCSAAAKFMMTATEYKWGILNVGISLASHIFFLISTPVHLAGWPAQVRLNQDALTQQFKHKFWGVFKHFCGENLQCCGENLTKALILKDQFTADSKVHEQMFLIRLVFVTSQSVLCVFSNSVSTVFSNYCKRAACECDRAAALCFARSRYNPRHKNLNQRFCRKWVNRQNRQERMLDFSLKFNFFMISWTKPDLKEVWFYKKMFTLIKNRKWDCQFGFQPLCVLMSAELL